MKEIFPLWRIFGRVERSETRKVRVGLYSAPVPAICGAGPNNPRGRGKHEVSGEGSNWTYFLRKSYPSSKSEISILPQGEDICFLGIASPPARNDI